MIDIVRSDELGRPVVWAMWGEEDREGIHEAIAAWRKGIKGAQPGEALQPGGRDEA